MEVVPMLLAASKFVVQNLVLLKPLFMKNKNVDPTYTADLDKLYEKDIQAMVEMLKFSSKESLQKIRETSKEKISSGKFDLSTFIVNKAVEKLLYSLWESEKE